MTESSVRVEEFGRFWKRYVLDHSTGKLTNVAGRISRVALWKGVFAILFGQKDKSLHEQKTDDWDSSSGVDYGVLKRFLFGPNVLVYRYEGVPYIRIWNKIEKIETTGFVSQCRFGPLFFYSIRCGGIRACAFDTQWFDFISRLIDPTYDALDRLGTDFVEYVKTVCVPPKN